MAVIKANGYGHDILCVARALHSADSLAVARIDEARKLREGGITNPIVLLEGLNGVEDLDFASQNQLEIVVHCDEQIQLLENHAGAPVTVWLKVDTGMGRLGFVTEEFSAARQRLQKNHRVASPVRLMTHLANADNRSDPKTDAQIKQFNDLTQGLNGERSIANSGGVLGWSSSHADWVRPGIMLYGASPFGDCDGHELGLQSVMTVSSNLIATKKVRKGDTVGYGGVWKAERDSDLGIAAIGYGDGYPRHISPGTPALVNGVRVSIVGRVSMDMLAVDLTNSPGSKVGDEVVLWGKGLPVEEIARQAGTIAYEVLCQITPRVQITVA